MGQASTDVDNGENGWTREVRTFKGNSGDTFLGWTGVQKDSGATQTYKKSFIPLSGGGRIIVIKDVIEGPFKGEDETEHMTAAAEKEEVEEVKKACACGCKDGECETCKDKEEGSKKADKPEGDPFGSFEDW